MSDIEWTDATWNPLVGCSRVSPGCEHCYAERFVHRGLSEQHRGLTVLGKGTKGPRWTGEVRLVESRLAEPLHWRKPKRVFVNSLSDLFHDALKLDDVARVFAVMAEARHHTFQVLTKRPKRMHALLKSEAFWVAVDEAWCSMFSGTRTAEEHDAIANVLLADGQLPNVWLGVTAEDQQRADERIPLLLDTPAAVRFVSYEPALGPVDFKNIASARDEMMLPLAGLTWSVRFTEPPRVIRTHAKLDWVIVGGESGPGARPFDLAWARSAVEQCREAGVPVFVKQLGAKPMISATPLAAPQSAESIARHGEYDPDPWTLTLTHRKGADPAEWPEELRVREFPR